MDVIGNIYQMYCDNVKEDGKTKLAGEAMEKEIRGFAARKLPERLKILFWITRLCPMQNVLQKGSGVRHF